MLDEQQETTNADSASEVVSLGVLEDSLVKKLSGVQVIRRVMSFHSTPLPDAETLGAYAELTGSLPPWSQRQSVRLLRRWLWIADPDERATAEVRSTTRIDSSWASRRNILEAHYQHIQADVHELRDDVKGIRQEMKELSAKFDTKFSCVDMKFGEILKTLEKRRHCETLAKASPPTQIPACRD